MSEFDRYTTEYWNSNEHEHKAILEEHLSRAKEGKDIWNKWAERFSEWLKANDQQKGIISFRKVKIPKTISFRGYKFITSADFREARFTGYVSFSEASFTGDANFNAATFTGDAGFREAMFTASAYFLKATFAGDADFLKTTFTGDVDFGKATFTADADFTNAVFEKSIEMGRTQYMNNVPEFNYSTFKQAPHLASVIIPFTKKGADVEKYRKLKKMSIESNDHANEVKFFGYETHAKYYDEKTPLSEKGFIKVYWLLSNFGASIGRPFVALIAVLVLLFAVNIAVIKPNGEACKSDRSLYVTTVAVYTLSKALPIMRLDREHTKEVKDCLFSQPVHGWKHALWPAVHVFFSAFLLFLIGLGVRNRFKIK